MTQESIDKLQNELKTYTEILEDLTQSKQRIDSIEQEIIAKEAVCQEGDTIVMSNTEFKVKYIIVDQNTNTLKYYFKRVSDGNTIVFTEHQLAFIKKVE